MKIAASLTLLLSLTISSAIACPNPSAQFIGTVESTQEVAQGCLVDVAFTRYDISQVCPLFAAEARESGVLLINQSCPAQDATISGYLLQDESGQVYRDDQY